MKAYLLDTPVLVAFITTIGSVLIAFITVFFSRKKTATTKHKLAQAESEIKLQQQALNFGAFVEEWGGTYKEIEALLDTTSVDRFMIFRAWNGRLAPRWTTAVFQVRRGMQRPVSYVHFELDTDYVGRLREISISGLIHFNVDELPDSAIKSVYQAEGVTAAVWVHIQSESVVGTDTVAHTYASFATRCPEKIDQTTVTKCSILAGRIKGLAASFKNE